MTQTEFLFGTPAYKLARSDAPASSKDAARSVNTTKMEQVAYDIIASYGPYGCIHDDVRYKAAELHGAVVFHSISARYSGLIEKGLITIDGDTRTGNSGRQQRVMRAVQ